MTSSLIELNVLKNWTIGEDSCDVAVFIRLSAKSTARLPSMSGIAPVSVSTLMHTKRNRVMKASLALLSRALRADGPAFHVSLRKLRVSVRACMVSTDGFISLQQAAPSAFEKCFHPVATND